MSSVWTLGHSTRNARGEPILQPRMRTTLPLSIWQLHLVGCAWNPIKMSGQLCRPPFRGLAGLERLGEFEEVYGIALPLVALILGLMGFTDLGHQPRNTTLS
jgi:hypothetical protein